jgi:hypothetical protein
MHPLQPQRHLSGLCQSAGIHPSHLSAGRAPAPVMRTRLCFTFWSPFLHINSSSEGSRQVLLLPFYRSSN